MATTSSELALITRELNAVRSAGQARAAVGAALVAITGGYQAVDRAYAKGLGLSVHPEVTATAKKELNFARADLETMYKLIEKIPANWDYTSEFSRKRDTVIRGYVAVAGAEGIAEWTPATSNWSILKRSIIEAPGVFLEKVASASTAIAGAAGTAAGGAVGGLFTGLGLVPTVLVIGAVVLYLKGFNPLAIIAGKLGGKA